MLSTAGAIYERVRFRTDNLQLKANTVNLYVECKLGKLHGKIAIISAPGGHGSSIYITVCFLSHWRI
jgi:hypothetical protein